MFTIKLTSGAATLVGTIGTGLTLTGLAAATPQPSAVPEPSTLLTAGIGVLACGGLGWRRRRRLARARHLSRCATGFGGKKA